VHHAKRVEAVDPHAARTSYAERKFYNCLCPSPRGFDSPLPTAYVILSGRLQHVYTLLLRIIFINYKMSSSSMPRNNNFLFG